MNTLVFEKNEKIDNFDKFCFWTILIDIFFLPYFSIISTSYSIPLIVLWFLLRGKRTHNVTEYKYFPLIVMLMLVAVAMSLVYFGETLYETSFMTSVKRFVQYLTSFWYFFFFVYYIKRYRPNLSKIIFWAVIYIATLGLFYFLFRDNYAAIKATLHPADNHTKRWLSGALYEYRYNFLWSDPNNVAYAVTSMVLFYFSEEGQGRLLQKIILLVSLAFILFCTMSIGGIITGVLSIVSFVIIKALSNRMLTIKTKTLISLPIILALGVLGIIVFWSKIINFLTSDVIKGVLRRISFYDNSSDITGGRFDDLTNAMKLLNPLFFFIGAGKEGFTTENGHIYLVAMYGLPVYIFFMYVLFGRKQMKLNKYIIFFPLFVGFTMNIAIIEQKYLLITLLFAAYFSACRPFHVGNRIA